MVQAGCQACSAVNLSLWFAGGLPGLNCKCELVFVVCRRVARPELQKLTCLCGLQAGCQAFTAKVNSSLWFVGGLPHAWPALQILTCLLICRRIARPELQMLTCLCGLQAGCQGIPAPGAERTSVSSSSIASGSLTWRKLTWTSLS